MPKQSLLEPREATFPESICQKQSGSVLERLVESSQATGYYSDRDLQKLPPKCLEKGADSGTTTEKHF
jgi:hypothetical protein